jgi:ParB/RepB/Spo0J family partition protein
MSQQLATVEADQLEPGATNPRQFYDPESIAEMAYSIFRLKGIQERIRVVPLKECDGQPVRTNTGKPKYQIRDGHRRYYGGLEAGLAEFPVIIEETKDTHKVADEIEIQLATEFMKEHFSEAEVGASFAKLLAERNWSLTLGARHVGKDKGWLSRCLKAERCLSTKTKQLNIEHKLKGATLFLLAEFAEGGLKEETIDKIASQVVEEGLTETQARKLLVAARGKKPESQNGEDKTGKKEELKAKGKRWSFIGEFDTDKFDKNDAIDEIIAALEALKETKK